MFSCCWAEHSLPQRWYAGSFGLGAAHGPDWSPTRTQAEPRRSRSGQGPSTQSCCAGRNDEGPPGHRAVPPAITPYVRGDSDLRAASCSRFGSRSPSLAARTIALATSIVAGSSRLLRLSSFSTASKARMSFGTSSGPNEWSCSRSKRIGIALLELRVQTRAEDSRGLLMMSTSKHRTVVGPATATLSVVPPRTGRRGRRNSIGITAELIRILRFERKEDAETWIKLNSDWVI